MLKTLSTVIVATTAIIVTAATCNADDDVSKRPAALDDLVGTWRMVELKQLHDFNRVDPFVLRYQRYHFAANGRMKTITSATPFTEGLLEIYERREPATTFEMTDAGEVTITSLAWRGLKRFTAQVVTSGQLEGETHPQAGDLILTWHDGSRPAAIKLLRKVREDERNRNRKHDGPFNHDRLRVDPFDTAF